MKRNWVPDSLVLIFAMIVAAQLLSYVVPSGEYQRVAEGTHSQVVPGSFAPVDADRLPAYAFLTAIPRGMAAAGDIIFLVFIVGGTLGVVRATGTIDGLLAATLRRFGHSPGLLIAGTMTTFALGSSTIGMAEEFIPLIPVLVAMCVAMEMDALVAVALVSVATGIGYGAAALNPFTVVIAQGIAGLPIYSGQLFRWCLFVVCIAVGIDHVYRYARRVHADSSRSLMAGLNVEPTHEFVQHAELTPRRTALLVVFGVGIAIFVVGVALWQWYLDELSAVFLAVTIVAAILGPLTPNQVAREFGKGAAELTMAALLIGFARSIEVVLDDAVIKDTVVHGIAGLLQGLPTTLAAVGMMLVQSACNFFIPSGSGQAYVTMPIMAPLSDLVGVSRQTAVLAYQFGDGFTNMLVPTNAVLMGYLALAQVPFVRWFKFVVPVLAKLLVIAALAMVVAVVTGY